MKPPHCYNNHTMKSTKYTTPTTPGHGRGKLLGYPTFNLIIPQDLKLKHGIYATWIWLPTTTSTPEVDSPKQNSTPEVAFSGKVKLKGAMHYGPVPVFGQPDPTLEIFVLDWQDQGQQIKQITFSPGPRLRAIKNFPTSDALAKQISIDVAQVRSTIKSKKPI